VGRMNNQTYEHPDVIVCPGGPMLLRGDHVVPDADGNPHATTRPVSAVCRCGKSSSSPWCDGTHKVLPTCSDRAEQGTGPT